MSNFSNPYNVEREGQIEFFENYGIPYNDDSSILVDNTDGIFNGNILEFKLSINNLNKVLFQALKYLSRMRIRGESIPATILLIDLNATTVYVYKSKDYFDAIHKVYIGAASKDNDDFIAGNYLQKLNYIEMVDSNRIKKILKERKSISEMYMPIDIDENCIVGWANRYYREKPTASKGDFLGDEDGTAVKVTGEIREPRHFKGHINPYTGKSNQRFKYLMDCLNDKLKKKDLGAFYTPMPYAKKAAELVQIAVDRVPDGNDYIILDRCAGTGNLQAALLGLTDKNGEELISHCVVSTYEYYEYKVLQERLGDKVRDIIPPTEANVVYENGVISNADAMSKEYIDNPIIKAYLNNSTCTIILFENPPYSDDSGSTVETGKSRGNSKSYIANIMNEQVQSPFKGLVQSKDIANCFIWSAFKYYLRQDTDSYIVFSPIKYWKTGHLVNSHFEKGFIFNREYFHAGASAITCSLWFNQIENNEEISYDVFNLNSDEIEYIKSMVIHKVHRVFSDQYFDKRVFFDDSIDGVYCQRNGYEGVKTSSTGTRNVYNANIIGWLHLIGFAFDSKNIGLVRTTLNLRKNGFYLRKDKYLEKLPLFCAKAYPQELWYEKDIFSTSADGGDKYLKDTDLLKSSLLFTCLTGKNKCISFTGSDGRFYRNELCFDNSNGNTLASNDLSEMSLDNDEIELMNIWNSILTEAKYTANYDHTMTYGIYQITNELNTSHYEGSGKSKRTVYDYPTLNGHLETLRTKLKVYYKSHITDKLFEYELLK